MPTDQPWLERWETKDPIGGGGQGSTFLAISRQSGTSGVLKILRYQQDIKARRRMFREVANLKILESDNCKTPKILDHNTERFEDLTVPLYFVMEYITGESLAALVYRLKGLSLEQSAQITLDMCATFRKATAQSVLHRDLKPENVIVRGLDPVDVVIVDYGLSFNHALDEAVTRASETLDNRFLSLPERRVPGGDRRDPRSDLAGLCGMLFFCLMGEPPVDLVDAKGLAPHRRQGRAIREKFSGDVRTLQLEAFFDRGFATSIDNRFQTIDELEQRLADVLKAVDTAPLEDPIEVAKRSGELLFQHDRKTQLAIYATIGKEVIKSITQLHARYGNSLGPYGLGNTNYFQGGFGHPPDSEPINCIFASYVTVKHNRNSMCIVYEIAARGTQCAVFRAVFKTTPPNWNSWKIIHEWKTVMWYEPLTLPDMTLVHDDFKRCVVESIKAIQEDILSSQTDQKAS